MSATCARCRKAKPENMSRLCLSCWWDMQEEEKLTRYAKRTDGNHAEIRDGLREWLEDAQSVVDYSGVGNGILDLIVRTPRRRIWFWLEVKWPGEKLTAAEARFFAMFPGITRMATSLTEAKAIVQDMDEEESE